MVVSGASRGGEGRKRMKRGEREDERREGKRRKDEERGGGDEWMDGVWSDITSHTSHRMDAVAVTVTVASRVRVLNSAHSPYPISSLFDSHYSTLLCCTQLLYGYHLKRIRTDYYKMYV